MSLSGNTAVSSLVSGRAIPWIFESSLGAPNCNILGLAEPCSTRIYFIYISWPNLWHDVLVT